MKGLEEYRLTYINYGLRESHRRFHRCLNTKDTQNSVSITASLSELLMWISISDEWHFTNNNEDGRYNKAKTESLGGQYVRGLRYAFNSIKHVMSFIKLIGTTGKRDAFTEGYYFEDYTTEVIWLNIDPLIEYDEKYKKQRMNYKNYVEGKAVIETVDKAYEFLTSIFAKVKSDSYSNRNI